MQGWPCKYVDDVFYETMDMPMCQCGGHQGEARVDVVLHVAAAGLGVSLQRWWVRGEEGGEGLEVTDAEEGCCHINLKRCEFG